MPTNVTGNHQVGFNHGYLGPQHFGDLPVPYGTGSFNRNVEPGVWAPGDVIGQLPEGLRPKSKCYFMAVACAAPAWPKHAPSAADNDL